MKKIISIAFLIGALCVWAVPTLAHERKDHDRILESVLFGWEGGGAKLNPEGKAALQALECASYLTLDQFNAEKTSNGIKELNYLNETYKVPGLPKTIGEIDFSGNSTHRQYTHRGWNHSYQGEDQGHWKIRKNILLATTEKVFNFSLLSGKILGFDIGYHKKCDSFAALVYYVHIIGDYEAKENYKRNELMISFAEAHPSRTNPDVFSELETHLRILFEDQRNIHTYRAMMGELNALAGKARNLKGTTGGINTVEEFNAFQGHVKALLIILRDYVPNLLKREAFFTDVFGK